MLLRNFAEVLQFSRIRGDAHPILDVLVSGEFFDEPDIKITLFGVFGRCSR